MGENDILNLMLRSNEGKFHQVLLSDRAGETYLKYTSSDDEVKDDLVIENADLLVFFVDAEADTQNLAVHNLIVEKYEGLLTRLKAQHKITASVSYIMVFTKIDKVVSDERREKLTAMQMFLVVLATLTILPQILCLLITGKSVGSYLLQKNKQKQAELQQNNNHATPQIEDKKTPDPEVQHVNSVNNNTATKFNDRIHLDIDNSDIREANNLENINRTKENNYTNQL